MHNKKKRRLRKKYNDYAKVLIIIALTFLVYGLVLDIGNEKRLFDPVKDVSEINKENNSTVSITTADGSEVVPGNTVEVPIESKTPEVQTPTSGAPVTSSAPASSGNSGGSGTIQQVPQQQQQQHTPTIDEINHNLRVQIQNEYNINVRYGQETVGYTVAGIATYPITDPTVVNNALNNLKVALSLYPKALFTEIKSNGIPLSVYLINNYSDNNITGVTDSCYQYAFISIAVAHPFFDSFYHESYHYIERCMFKKGYNFNSWNSLNPNGFSYGNVYRNLSYSDTFNEQSYFVNTYAESSDAEDRASTFEFMMAGSKASCLNYGNPVWKKAYTIKATIESAFSSVSPNYTEYWERYV